MHIYQLTPIDFGWEKLPHVNVNNPEEMTALYSVLMMVSKKYQDVGFDNNFRECPRVLMLPDPSISSFIKGYVWKQCHAGVTYVVSPIPINYLKEYEV